MASVANGTRQVNSRDGRPPTAYFIAPHDHGVRAWFLLGEKRIERGPVRGTKKTLRSLQSRRGHLEVTLTASQLASYGFSQEEARQ